MIEELDIMNISDEAISSAIPNLDILGPCPIGREQNVHVWHVGIGPFDMYMKEREMRDERLNVLNISLIT